MYRQVPLIDGKAIIVIESGDDDISFTAPLVHGSDIQFYACLHSRASMCNVASAMLHSLRKASHTVSVHNYFGFKGWADKRLASAHGIDRQAPVGFFLGLPTQVPEFFYSHPTTIGVFVCESDRIPDRWVYNCNRMDLIVVPSQFCRQAFIDSGVKVPVMVVPHGLEAEYRPVKEKQRDTRLIFFNTFFSSSLCQRKSMEELVRCFLKAFDGRTDVVLRLRTDHSLPLVRCQAKYDFGSLIEVDLIKKSLPIGEYANIYDDVHCTVHPSKGEGFGLVPFQSIAKETPVIAPHTTGMADYLDDTNSVSLNTSGRTEGEGLGNEAGTYFSIDEDHLVDRLRYMADNWEAEYAKVRESSLDFRAKYTWDNVMLELSEWIKSQIHRTRGGGQPVESGEL